MKRCLKCLRRVLCKFDRLDQETQNHVMCVLLVWLTGGLLLAGYVWSLLPGVASFTQITGDEVFLGVVFNAFLIGDVLALLFLGGRVIYTALTSGVQVVRGLTDHEAPRPGDLAIWPRYVIPRPLSDLVLLVVCTLATLLFCTLGVYLSALIGLQFFGPFAPSCRNLTSAQVAVLCHRTPGECMCGVVSGSFCVLATALIVFFVCWMKRLVNNVTADGPSEIEVKPLL